MNQLIFGVQNKLIFSSENEFYEALGLLAKTDKTTEVIWEWNKQRGAYENEGRIHCYKDLHKFPAALVRKFTKGRKGSILQRINCNEYIIHLRTYHGFQMNERIPNPTRIRLTVPTQYLADFDRGYKS